MKFDDNDEYAVSIREVLEKAMTGVHSKNWERAVQRVTLDEPVTFFDRLDDMVAAAYLDAGDADELHTHITVAIRDLERVQKALSLWLTENSNETT